VVLVACRQQAPPQDDDPAESHLGSRNLETHWPEACQKIRARLDPATAGQRARRLPPRAIPPDPWTLHLGSFGVTLEQDDYLLEVNRSGKGSLSALLEASGRQVLVIRDPPEAPLDDVFAMEGDLVPTAARRAWTNELFGSPPTSFELVRMGYRHTLDELTCKATRAKTEIPIALGLILKETGHWAEQVYDLGGLGAPQESASGSSGLLLLGQRGERCVVEIQVRDRAASTYVTHLSGERQPCIERAARVQIRSDLKPAGPPWLSALGRALVQPEAGHWRSLREELVRAGAPQESVASVEAMLEGAGTGD